MEDNKDPIGADCTHSASITQYTGDGAPIDYCPDCGRNEPSGAAVCGEAVALNQQHPTLDELHAVICDDGKVGNYLGLGIAEKVLKAFFPVSARAADALDSQPTDGSKLLCAMEFEAIELGYAGLSEALAALRRTKSDPDTDREALIACLGDDAATLSHINPDDEMAQTMREAAAMLESDEVVIANLGMASQPQPASQSIGENAQFGELLENVASRYQGFKRGMNVHGFLSAVTGLHGYIDHLLDSRASAAPVTPDSSLKIISDTQKHLVDTVRAFGDISCAAYLSTWHKPELIAKALGIPAPQQEGSEVGNGNG